MTLHDQQRETSLDKRRGHRPCIKAGPRTGRRPVLTLADRLLATILQYRLAPPQVAIAALFQPGPHRLANLDDLYKLARSTGIAI